MSTELTPEMVVQRQLDSYNAKQLDHLMETYAPDAQQFEHPSTLLADGADAIRERFVARFEEPNLRADLLKRTVMGQIVVDYERITRTFPEGPGVMELIAIYEVRNSGIARAWFIAGPKQLDKLP